MQYAPPENPASNLPTISIQTALAKIMKPHPAVKTTPKIIIMFVVPILFLSQHTKIVVIAPPRGNIAAIHENVDLST